MGINYNPEMADVNDDSYVSGSVSVTSSQIEAKVGTSRLAGRETITITNKGNKTIYYGPSGVTSTSGDSLFKDQFVCLNFGASIGVFLICASGDTATAIVQEMG